MHELHVRARQKLLVGVAEDPVPRGVQTLEVAIEPRDAEHLEREREEAIELLLRPAAIGLLDKMRREAGEDGGGLIGVDLKKDVGVLEAAYNDARGVTAAFNRNMLLVLNHELGADFEPAAFEQAQEFMQIVMPRSANRIKLYSEPEPIFHKYGIEEEIVRIQQRHVPLPNGGSLVIDQTEALVAIDVNSGNFRTDGNAEESAYQLNTIAAKETARQLRLRDLGGVVVNDFIDMRKERNRRNVERTLRDAVRRDRARTKILRTSPFGLIEMTRQRIRPSLKRSVYKECPACAGSGLVKSAESMAIEVIRKL